MINLREYYENNSIKVSRNKQIPKRFLSAFVLRHKGEKSSSIFKYFKDTFGSNTGYRLGYDSFISDTFELGPLEKIISLKDEKYNGYQLNSEYPFTDSLRNGLYLVKSLLAVDEISELNEELLFKLINLKIENVEDICIHNEVINCGINQNLFDFTIARECLLNQTKLSSEEISKQFYDLIIFDELFDSLITSVKPANHTKCLKTLREMGLITFEGRNEITNLYDLRTLSISYLFYYLADNIGVLINVLNYYSENSEDVVPKLLKNYLSTIDRDNFEILSRREHETLEAIGQDRNLTRERIRQIEAKEIEKFQEFYLNNFSSDKKNLIFVFPKISDVFSLNSLSEVLGDQNDCFKNLMKSIKYVGTAKYYKNIDAIVQSDRIYEFFCNTVDEILGRYFRKDELEERINACLDSLSVYGFDEGTIKLFIKNEYKENDFNFVKNGQALAKVHMVNILLESYFDNGFHFSDLEDIKQINELSKKEFGVELFDFSEDVLVNPHSVQAVVERADVRLVDRGTYIHKTKAHDLPFELVDKISNYLREKNRALAYSNIFETFKDEFESLGITNRYALQGALSIYEGELFNGKRDYVTPIEVQSTLRESINEWIKSRTSLFSYEEFSKEYKGVAMSVFMSALYEVGGTAYYWSRGYVKVSNLNISSQTIETLDKLLEYQINQYHMEYCSADEIFNLVNLQMHNFIVDAGITYSYDLFSILQVLFADKYKFKRPLIGTKDAVFEDKYELVDGYLSVKNTVKLMKLRKFLDTKTGQALDSYLPIFDIIVRKWNDFIAIDIDTIIRKESLSITEKDLIRLDVIVEMLLEQKSKLDIEEDIVNKYFFNEIAGIKVSKYLIFGILNSYFHEKYKLSVDKQYRGGTFYIESK